MRSIIMIVAIAAGWSSAASAEYRTAAWYADHPAMMRGVLKLCRANPGLATRNPNCANAEQAEFEVGYREFTAHQRTGR
jgi:hypothetical protein